MTKRVRVPVAALAACFFTGIAAGWLLRSLPVWSRSSRVVDGPNEEIVTLGPGGAGESSGSDRSGRPGGSSGQGGSGGPGGLGEPKASGESDESDSRGLFIASDAIAELRQRHLRLPLERVDVKVMKGQFGERRADGTRGHEAVDLLAPRNTPVLAVEDGTIAKLFNSKAGGTTIYQFDREGRFCYYYAHLESYASGLGENQHVSAGDVIGYVGTSGNAPKNTPHLHFAIFELTPERRWWQGRALDPYLVFKK